MTEGDNSSELAPKQEDTANLLERVLGRAIANRYVDFCRLASGAFELRVSRPIAGHALRELESTLRHALKVPLEVKAVAAAIDPEKLDTARRALEEMGFDGAAVERAASALQPRETHATQIEQITARLGLAPGGDIAKAWISLVKTFGQPLHSGLGSPLADMGRQAKLSEEEFAVFEQVHGKTASRPVC